jgi:hypothetical protein
LTSRTCRATGSRKTKRCGCRCGCRWLLCHSYRGIYHARRVCYNGFLLLIGLLSAVVLIGLLSAIVLIGLLSAVVLIGLLSAVVLEYIGCGATGFAIHY